MKKKKITAALCLLGILVCSGIMDHKQETLTEAVAGEVKRALYESTAKSCMPGFYYKAAEGGKEKSAWEYVAEQITTVMPVYGYVRAQKEYETPVESELSYETLVKLEALDENYLDETTGEVILAAQNENEAHVLSEAETENMRARDGEQESTETPKAPEETEVQEEQTTQPVEAAVTVPAGFLVQNEKVVSYPLEKLNDFDYLIQNFYTVDRTTTINSAQLSASELLSRDMTMKTPASQPQILIYHTHSQELYADSTPGDVMTGVVGCGEYLKELLTGYGYQVIHHMGQYDVEKRDYAYSNAAPAIEQLLAENPSIEVVIDLHRDAVREDVHLVRNVQGVDMAPVMFFNGLSRLAGKGDIDYLKNPYIMDNLAFSLQMKLAASEYYPDLTRPIYLKGYRYNMHYCPKTLLVELGAQTNTFAEAKNAMEPLADLLHKVLGDPQG